MSPLTANHDKDDASRTHDDGGGDLGPRGRHRGHSLAVRAPGREWWASGRGKAFSGMTIMSRRRGNLTATLVTLMAGLSIVLCVTSLYATMFHSNPVGCAKQLAEETARHTAQEQDLRQQVDRITRVAKLRSDLMAQFVKAQREKIKGEDRQEHAPALGAATAVAAAMLSHSSDDKCEMISMMDGVANDNSEIKIINTGFNEKLTVIIMAYSLEREHHTILQCYASMGDVIEQIIFIWNRPELPPKSHLGQLLEPKRGVVPIALVHPKRNAMTNRFNVSEYVITSACLLVDDDVLMSAGLIAGMLHAWLLNKATIGLRSMHAELVSHKWNVITRQAHRG